MIDTARLDAAFDRLPEMTEGETKIAIDIGFWMHGRRVPTDWRVRIALSLIGGFAKGLTLVVNDGSVPASSLHGVEDLALVAATLREAADIFDQVHKAALQ